jgi:hypothetical protein
MLFMNLLKANFVKETEMLELDGKPIDLTKPQTWGDSIKIKPNGYIEQTKDGVTIRVEPAPQQKEPNHDYV